MQHVNTRPACKKPAPNEKASVKPAKLGSVALARLIEEVRVGDEVKLDAYNRTYHRHNR
jgi:hypothetical protein